MKPTEEQIRNGSDEQLTEWAAFFFYGWKKRKERYLGHVEEIWYDPKTGKGVIEVYNWNPAQNIGQAFELEERIIDLNLGLQYGWKLAKIVFKETGSKEEIKRIHATPRQRVIAALLAKEGE